MDLRIVNTCNNNCLYCLEQDYRKKDKYENFLEICNKITNSKTDKIINFYGWNPILHPEILQILEFSKKSWFDSIWLLTNTYWLDQKNLNSMISAGLNSIWFYFNSFDVNRQNIISGNWITIKELLKNIENISRTQIFYKVIIHINKQNIDILYRDIYILYQKFFVREFEFINYFPFDRPYENFRDLLEFDYDKNRKNIDKLFKVIKTNNLSVKFYKFSLDFFWEYREFYNFDDWILNQIWEEDNLRLKEKTTFCYKEIRCNNCFIKDNCKFYGK